MKRTLKEQIAKLCHEQWVQWSKNIASTETISVKRLRRWDRLWVNYDVLVHKEKEKDRYYADKIIKYIQDKDKEIEKLRLCIKDLKQSIVELESKRLTDNNDWVSFDVEDWFELRNKVKDKIKD